MTLAGVDEHELTGARLAERYPGAHRAMIGPPFGVSQQAFGHDHGDRQSVAVLRHPLAGGQPESDDAHRAAVSDLLPTERSGFHPGRIIIASVTQSPGRETELVVLGQAEVARLLDLELLLDGLATAFVELSGGRTSAPPRVAAQGPAGLLAVMPGYVPGAGLAAKLVTVFPGNHESGLPSHQALIGLFDEATGRPLAILDGTHITAVRTAAAAALSARILARPDVRVLAILGAGVQGGAHLEAMTRVRDFHEIRVASRTPGHAEALSTRSPRARSMRTFEQAVRGADVVCCCTDSPEPVISYSWLAPGTHVTSVGANLEGPELDAATVRRSHLFVESRMAFSPPPAGSAELLGLDPSIATEVGEVLAGAAPGRTSADEITVYKSMGHAVEDLAAVRIVYEAALREGAGARIKL